MNALMIAAPLLGLIGLGVAGVGLFGRDRTDDEHTVDDYRPATMLQRVEFDAGPELDAVPVEEPAVPWRPPYAELTVAAVTRRYGDSPADIAARWLRDAGEQARAGLAAAR